MLGLAFCDILDQVVVHVQYVANHFGLLLPVHKQ